MFFEISPLVYPAVVRIWLMTFCEILLPDAYQTFTFFCPLGFRKPVTALCEILRHCRMSSVLQYCKIYEPPLRETLLASIGGSGGGGSPFQQSTVESFNVTRREAYRDVVRGCCSFWVINGSAPRPSEGVSRCDKI